MNKNNEEQLLQGTGNHNSGKVGSSASSVSSTNSHSSNHNLKGNNNHYNNNNNNNHHNHTNNHNQNYRYKGPNNYQNSHPSYNNKDSNNNHFSNQRSRNNKNMNFSNTNGQQQQQRNITNNHQRNNGHNNNNNNYNYKSSFSNSNSYQSYYSPIDSINRELSVVADQLVTNSSGSTSCSSSSKSQVNNIIELTDIESCFSYELTGKRQHDENSHSGSRTSLNKNEETSMNSKSNGRNNERDNSHYSLSRDSHNGHKSKNNNNSNNHSQKMKEQNVYNRKSNPNSININGNNKGCNNTSNNHNNHSSNYNGNNNNNSNANNHSGNSHSQNYQFQAAPFQPASYHNHKNNYNNNHNYNNLNNQNQNHHNSHNHNHNHNNNHIHIPKQFNNIITNQNHKQYKFMIEKYNTKYNLISFILLRKNDEYLGDYRFYFNDQSLYQKADRFIEQRQLDQLAEMFHSKEAEIFGNIIHSPEHSLTNFTNSYNCNLFVYVIRKCLENEAELRDKTAESKPVLIKTLDENNNEIYIETEPEEDTFLDDLITMLFSEECCPNTFFLIDGDFPKRNVMHYAATYNCTLIPSLILKSQIQERPIQTDKMEGSNIEEVEKACKRVLDDITDKICGEFKEQEPTVNFQNNSELNLIQLCTQTDFNGNTPIHLAAINDSYDLLKMIHPLCIRYSQFVYNEDGLNPFLLACRHASVEFIKHLVEQQQQRSSTDQFLENTDIDLLQCRDKVNFKNCLHYACGRGCGNDALKTITYLTDLAARQCNTKTRLNELIGAISPLIGSVHHAAASNLTRLSTLWYLLSCYPSQGILVNNESILNSLDFRDFTCVDCLFDAVMNLREMAHPNCKILTDFYNELLGQDQSVVKNTESDFRILLNRCIYKLSIEYHASFFNLPRIKNQWQLLEFLRIIVFMVKFYTDKKNLTYLNSGTAEQEKLEKGKNSADISSSEVGSGSYNKVYGQNFELFLVNFCKKFIVGGDVLPAMFSADLNAQQENNTDSKIPQNSNSKNDKKSEKQAAKNPDETYVLTEIMVQLYELVSFCLVSKPSSYSKRFRSKLTTYLNIYLKNMDTYWMYKNSIYLARLSALLNSHNSTSESLSNSPTSSSSSSSDSSSSSKSTTSETDSHFVYKPLSEEEESAELLSLEENLEYKAKLVEIKQKAQLLNRPYLVPTLKNQCRQVINDQLTKASASSSRSILSADNALFKLPGSRIDGHLVNFLSYNLIDDLYGTDFSRTTRIQSVPVNFI